MSNNSNKIHPTWEALVWRSLYCTISPNRFQALRDTFAALFAHLPPEEMRETVSRRLEALGAGEELESSNFQVEFSM